jgi:hypothetical protein
MLDNGPSSDKTFTEKNDAKHYPVELCPVPVQPLFKEPVQGMSSLPVQPVSIIESSTGWTDSEQRSDTQNEQPFDRGDAQGVNTHFEQGVNTPTEQPVNSHEDTPEPVYLLRENMASWTVNQDKMLRMFRRYGHCVTNLKVIGENLGIPYGTVRNILRRLTSAGLIRSESYKNATVQGLEVWYCGPEAHLADPEFSGTFQSSHAQCGQAICTVPEHPVWTGVEHSVYKDDREKDKEREENEKNQSILTLSKSQIDELWPNMGKAGLFASEIQKVKSAMNIQGIEDNPEKIIAQSLRFIDWQLSQGPIIDQHGKKVEKPVAYWQASMMRHGYYQKPAGYADPEVLALQQLAEEENALIAARHAVERHKAEREKIARREELNGILQALAEKTESHPLWPRLLEEWTETTKLEIHKNPQAIVDSPGIAATTRIALRRIYDWPE